LGLHKELFIAIDLGLNNLITAVENRCRRPIIISGKFIKSFNQWWNKNKARLQHEIMKLEVNWKEELDSSDIHQVRIIATKLERNWEQLLKNLSYKKEEKLSEIEGNEWIKGLDEDLIMKIQSIKSRKKQCWTNKLQRITEERNNWIDDVFHKISTAFINYCKEAKIGNLVIPILRYIKRGIDHGKRINQNFYYVPLQKFREMLIYKAQVAGMRVWDKVEEWYTSKVSALDKETIGFHAEYIGKRVSRGMFKGSNFTINADVNGALNILRKVIKDQGAFLDLHVDSGCWFRPVRIKTLDKLSLLNSDVLDFSFKILEKIETSVKGKNICTNVHISVT